MNRYSFSDQTVVITGGTAGIGKAAGLAFARLGARVVLVGRDEDRGLSAVAELASIGASARFVDVDVTSSAGRSRLLEEVPDADVLVNNAGYRAPMLPAVDLEEGDFDRTFDANVKAAYFLSALFGRQMASRGRGAIVNVSSINAVRNQPAFAAYNASKAALDALTRAFAEELGPSGVRVNAVAPGPTWTPYTRENFADVLDDFMASNPVPGPGEAEEVADAIVFLAGDTARHVTGAVLPVDGGRLAILGS
jgi:NAD(P)-dependent dehydrogenase (short-subunit alcohol dehydrogenase family)